MSLFRTSLPSGDFAPLFRLLDDYDVHRASRQTTTRAFHPRFDVREGEDSYHLDGELPGIAQKDINIEFTDSHTLVVKGRTEREYHTTEPKENTGDDDTTVAKPTDETETTQPSHRFWASERSVGEFQRTFTFPGRIDQDNVKASLKNGILSIVIPKSTVAATKKITIE
ncbi:30 kDa heat shock protein [Penicillium cataractarum]|uniref:30 kDa heat shock protein n=1 Tax=Penicillium cataractarum TaxID=2100454 RepID=A0A9W9SEI1_9EURO|nr:30 kDa heat shock protein [Penicillium cataractarum]KAJ5377136.1 30 kDa heat shock protein [Penicillium cataractarum]